MARARKNDLHTSHKAAEKVEPRVTDIQREILAYFVHRRCMTDWDLEEHFRDHGSTYRTRRDELTGMGYIVNSNQTKIIKSTERVIWCISSRGEEAAKIFPVVNAA